MFYFDAILWVVLLVIFLSACLMGEEFQASVPRKGQKASAKHQQWRTSLCFDLIGLNLFVTLTFVSAVT